MLKFQFFSFALQTWIFESSPFILVPSPTLNLIKLHWTHMFNFSFWFSLCSCQLPSVLDSFLPAVCLTPRPDPTTNALACCCAPLGIIDRELRPASVPGESKGLCRGGEHVFLQHPVSMPQHPPFISIVNFKGVYHFCNRLSESWWLG